MLRWFKAWLAAALWGYLLMGGIGLIEGISQWLRFDVMAGQAAPVGPVRLFLPPFVLYGWAGMLLTGLIFLPLALLGRWSIRPRRFALCLSIAGSIAVLVAVYAGYLLRVHLLESWWEARGGDLGTLLAVCVGLAALWVSWRFVHRLSAWLTHRHTATLAYPVLVVIVTTSLWPDWRAEGRLQRTAHLERRAIATAPQTTAPHLILITIDTLRRDCLSLLNPQAPPTPNLNGLAAESEVFTQAWATSPWTLPSMATIMTGLPPRSLQLEQFRPLPDQVPRLAEIAWRQGYRTAAFATNPYLTSWYGFDRGFAFFEHALVLETLLPAERSLLAREITRYANDHFPTDGAEFVIPKTMTWLWQRGKGDPFFLWIHLMNPHLPYRWHDMPGFPPRMEEPTGRQPRKQDVPNAGYFKGRVFRALHPLRQGLFVPDAREREAIWSLYAHEVQFTDFWLGKLFSELKRLRIWERATIVVCADHGEEFFEHGGFEHGHTVMPEVTGVPLLIKTAGGRQSGSRHGGPVSLLDLMPTICDLMGWPLPVGSPGKSLWPPSRLERPGADAAAAVPLVMENLLYEPQQRGVLAWPWFQVTTEGRPDAVWYDLSADRQAVRPRAKPTCGQGIVARADSLLAIWDRQADTFVHQRAGGEQEVPTDIKRKLRALGY